MIANGIYVKSSMDYLAGELCRGVYGLKRIIKAEDLPPDSPGSARKVSLCLNDREDEWCHVQLTGDTEGVVLAVKSLTGHELLEKVLVWDCNHESAEYNYSFFIKGKLLEQFNVQGPALETVNFISELRQVQLQDLIKGRDFAEEAFVRFGLNPDAGTKEESESIRIDFALPTKRSFWKSLLGSLAGGE